MNAKEETKLPLEKAPRRIITREDIEEDAEDTASRLYELRIKRDKLLDKSLSRPGFQYKNRIIAMGKEIREEEKKLKGASDLLGFPIPIAVIEVM